MSGSFFFLFHICLCIQITVDVKKSHDLVRKLNAKQHQKSHENLINGMTNATPSNTIHNFKAAERIDVYQVKRNKCKDLYSMRKPVAMNKLTR